MLDNYASGMRASVTPLTLEILEHCGTWRTTTPRSCVAVGVPRQPAHRQTILAVLVEATFLERSRSTRPPRPTRAFEQWDDWNPAAGFFHASTKNVA